MKKLEDYHYDSLYPRRKQLVFDHINDPLTDPIENLRFIYRWMRLEFALLKRDIANQNIKKYGELIDAEQAALELRHEMEKNL